MWARFQLRMSSATLDRFIAGISVTPESCLHSFVRGVTTPPDLLDVMEKHNLFLFTTEKGVNLPIIEDNTIPDGAISLTERSVLAAEVA